MFVINRICRLILKRKGMEQAETSVVVARLSSLAKHRVKESSMRVKKRVKRGVKKGIKNVKSAPPEAYLVGMGLLVGGAAVLLLATTRSGQELLVRAAQQVLRPEADDQESNVKADAHDEPAEDADVEEPEEDTNRGDVSRVAA